MSSWVVHVPRFKALFLSQPKVASTSLLPIVGRLAGFDLDYERLDFRLHLPKFPLDEVHLLQDHFCFAFVRNPWARLVSCYAHSFIQVREEGGDCVPPYFKNPGCFRLEMGFQEFAEAVCHLPDDQTDVHARSQCTFLTDSAGRWLPHFVGRIESLERDWKIVCSRAGFPAIRAPHENRSCHEPYQRYYDKRLRDLVGQRYERDIRKLDYDFQGPPLPRTRTSIVGISNGKWGVCQ